jgi:uncharacterized Fe-S center protein
MVMDTETVFFTPWKPFENMLTRARELYQAAHLFDVVEKGDLVAVKLHMGELGNPNYIRPFFVKQIVDLIKERGGKPFLTDTSTYYPVARSNAFDYMETAVANGFGFAPLIIADGLNSENASSVPSPDPLLPKVEVAGAIQQAQAMIVVSHLKGHPLAGYGGAIKNLGLGCVSKKTKLAQHRVVDIEVNEELCKGCGACVEACWFGLPSIENYKATMSDHPECMRCLNCASACPEGAVKLVGRQKLGEAIAIAARAVLTTFREDKVAYINFAHDISTFCDCVPFQGELIGPDLGIFAGFSPLSIDAAGLKRIDYQQLDKIHSTECLTQVNSLARLNQPGSLDPKVVEV